MPRSNPDAAKSAATTAAPEQGRRRRRPIFTPKNIAPYLFVLPNMLVFGIFTIWPALNMFNYSLYDSTNGRRFTYVGIANFTELVNSKEFGQVFWHTVLFTVGFVGLTVILSTLFAVLLNDAFPGRSFFRSILFLPALLSAVVVGLLWNWILDRGNGLLNIMLGAIGLPQPGWLTDGRLTLIVVVLVSLWMHTGFYTLIMLSGLQGIDGNVYEAAKVDGATGIQRFLQITWPLLRPTTLVVLILSTISGFQSFDFIYTLTGGGPVGATTLIVQYIYERAFESPIRYGLGFAGGVILFVCVFAFTLINYLNGRRQEAA
ncbi:carbohydrate ABC transporter permease [Mariniluteicoccus flavus]